MTTIDTARQAQERKVIFAYHFFAPSFSSVSYRLTDHDQNITIMSKTYYAAPINKSTITRVSDDGSDSVTVNVGFLPAFRDQATAAASEGLFLKIYECYTEEVQKTSFTTNEFAVCFTGFARGPIIMGDKDITVTFNSTTAFFQRDILHFQFQRQCNHTLYSGVGCQANKEDHKITAKIVKIFEGREKIQMTGSYPTEYVGGFVEFANGTTRTIVNIPSPQTVEIIGKVPDGINQGDTIFVYRGCDRTFPTCKNIFNQAINFGGAPFIKTRSLGTDLIE